MSDTRTEIITNDVFISWTGKDKAIKDAVKAHLEDKGLTCTDSQIDCAGNYFEWSKQAATVSHIAVLILTENSIKSSTYQKTELQEIVKVFGENFSNRLVTFCPNQAVYNLETFGENGESLLADNYNSAAFFGKKVTREALEDLATKVTNLLLGRTFEIYKAACEASERKMGLLSFFVDRQQGNTSVDYDKIYIERNVKGGGGNELSAKELLASGDLLLVYGPSGMGKTEYIKQLRRAAAPEVLTVVVRCSDLWRSGKTVYGYLYANVASGVQNAAFTDKHFERLWSGRDRLVVFDGLDEVPTTATTDLFFQKIGEFCQAKADDRRTQLVFTSRNKDDANRFANDSADVKSRLRSFELQPLNDDQIRKLCASLGQVFGFDGDDFSFGIKRLDEEIKTNPLLVSQLAIIFKNDGSIPSDSMEMTEKLAEIVFGVEDRAKVLMDVKGAEITNLRALVEAFAALKYEYPEENDVDVMDEALESCNERADSAHVLEYFKKRAIYVDGRYLHKSLGEFFAAYGFARRACGLGGKVKDKELLDFVIRHCGDDSWGSVVNWFVRKTKLKTVVIPEEVKSIGTRAFNKCGTLTSVTIPKSVTSIGDEAFSGCSGLTSVTIPDGVTSIGERVFFFSGLTSVTIPDSVTSIASAAFSGCSEIIQTENGVSYVNDWVIGCNTSVTSVQLREWTRGIADNAFSRCSGLTSIVIPDSVTSIGDRAFRNCSDLTSITIPDSVTSIGKDAFFGCSGLKSITIPDSVTSIGEYAFSRCSGLTSVTISDSVTSIGRDAFSRCSGLISVTIGTGVTSIGSSAFSGCSGLTSIMIPDSVTSIGEYAFSRCSGLTSVTIGNGVTSIGEDAFSGCSGLISVTIGTGVTSIGEYAFSGCCDLTSVTIPDSVTSVGDSAFWKCSGLTSITIPDSVTSIGKDAFSWCSGLISVTIGTGVTSIGDWAFSKCSGLTSVTIGTGVTSIGKYAFSGCSGLKSVTIPDSVTSIGEYAFSYCEDLVDVFYKGDLRGWLKIEFGDNPMRYTENIYINGELLQGKLVIPEGVEKIGNFAFVGCSGLTSIAIPNSVTSIGEYAFSGCCDLTSVTIPDSVVSIGKDAFSGCSGLTSITIPFVGEKMDGTGNTRFDHIFVVDVPDSLKEVVITGGKNIGERAFFRCSGLTSVTIGNSVTSIGDGAFSGCKGLASVTIGDDVTSIGEDAFSGCSGLKSVTIPDGVTSIGGGAFSGCSGLTSVTIPVSVTSIGDYAFYSCSSLTSITYHGTMSQWRTIKKGDYWDEDVPVYKVHCADGVLIKNGNHFDEVPQVQVFGEERGDAENRSNASLASDALNRDNAMTVINDRAYAGRSDFTSIAIPDNVSSIGKKAFFACGLLMDGTIGEGVVSIGKKAFAWCINLRKITIGGNVSSIGKRAFKRCRSLTTITYHGTMAQWRAIKKGVGWDYGTPDYKVHCTDGVLDKDDD